MFVKSKETNFRSLMHGISRRSLMKCVVFFTLEMWGSGYMTKLLAIISEVLYAGALVQLTVELIMVLVF
jgi:hypothetical protein